MWRRTSRDRIFVGLLILATVTVLTLDFRTGALQGLSGGVTQVIGVFQAGVRTVARPIEGVVESVQGLRGVRAENEQLREENQLLRRQAEAYTDVARENARLRELLQLESSLELETVSARVIGASLSGLERTALVDKGSESGLEVDSAVLGPEGFAGRIIWVGPQMARVRLITDPQSAVGVRIGDIGETGSVVGTGRDELRLELVSRAALDQGAVRRGDVVTTSGYQGGIFPPGIPVGRIEEVQLAERGADYTIRVRPLARLSRLDVVSVVRRDPGPQPAPPPGGGGVPEEDVETGEQVE